MYKPIKGQEDTTIFIYHEYYHVFWETWMDANYKTQFGHSWIQRTLMHLLENKIISMKMVIEVNGRAYMLVDDDETICMQDFSWHFSLGL